jgi:hypothetical protein
MRILTGLLTCVALLLFAAAVPEGRVVAQQGWGSNQDTPGTQNRLVGEVQTANAGTNELVIKTDDGRSVTLRAQDRASLLRIPPGETNPKSAAKIALAEIAAGDRVFARGELSADGQSFSATQIVVANKQAVAQTQTAQREDWQRRGIAGRIEALNAEKKEITIRTRTREGGAQAVVIDASGKVKFSRNAPDSARAADAVSSSFSDLKVGDQLRARGERSSDGTRFTAEEITVNNTQRAGGTVVSVNAAANEVVIRSEQTGQTQTIVIGQRSMLRRITPELAAQMAERRAQNNAGGGAGNGRRRAEGNNNAGGTAATGAGSTQTAGGGETRRRPGGNGGGPRGGGFQEMIQNLPAITLNDLKKGDVVMVTGSAMGTDRSRLTAMTLVTGDADFLKRLMQLQGRPNRDGQNMSPGLPSDVVGGGTNNSREQP